MKHCPTCNSEYADQYRFCRLDGTPLVEKRARESAQAESEIGEVTEMKSKGLEEPSSETQNLSESLTESPLPLTESIPPSLISDEPSTEAKLAVIQENFQESARDLPYDVEARETEQRLESRPIGGERFELLAQQEIKKAFPSAFVRVGVQIRSLRRTTEADLFVLLPKGLFLIECKNYSGKISGSMNYDQEQGEFWTCETESGEVVEIKSSGKNPADQALTRFYALHDLAKEAWGENNRPYIHPVLLFPDGADLSGVTGLPIYPEKPSTRDRVVATTLTKIIPYLANADAPVEPVGALKLANEILGIPRSSLSGTWLDQPFKTEEKTPEQESYEETWSFQEPEGPPAEDRYSFDEGPPREPRHRSTRRTLVAATAVVVGVLLLLIIGRWIFYPGSTQWQDLASRQETSLPQLSEGTLPSLVPEGESPPTIPDPIGESTTASPEKGPKTGPLSGRRSPPDVTRETTPGGGKVSPTETQEQPPSAIIEAKLPEKPTSRKPAEPGTYETTRLTYARRTASDSADVLDELKPGVRFEVVSSDGDWLAVRSKKRQAIVYIKRDDAMFVSAKTARGESVQEAEARWKKVELEISEVLLKRGITGVTVSLIGDTAFLKGQVKTDMEKFVAEQAARSMPEVQHIHNGIWVVP